MATWDPREILNSVGLEKTEQKRSVRVADVIRHEVSILLINKLQDPKVQNVYITRVEVTDDLKHARLFFTVLGGKKEVRNAQSGLQRAKGFIRSHLAKTLNLRYTPALQFRYDETAEKVEEVEKLFQEIASERKRDDS